MLTIQFWLLEYASEYHIIRVGILISLEKITVGIQGLVLYFKKGPPTGTKRRLAMSPARTDDIPVFQYLPETKEKRRSFSSRYTLVQLHTNDYVVSVDYADLEALDISKWSQPGGKQALAEQVLSFINKNGE